MNSVSTAIKPEPISRAQNRASVSVSVITVIIDAIHRKLASGNRPSQFYVQAAAVGRGARGYLSKHPGVRPGPLPLLQEFSQSPPPPPPPSRARLVTLAGR